MRFEFKITPKSEERIRRLRRRFDALPEITQEAGRKIAERYREQIKRYAPRGVTGFLEDSINVRFEEATPERAVFHVYSTASYILPTEYGSKPHWIPPDARVHPRAATIREWAEYRGIKHLYLLRKRIAERGTKAHPFIRYGIEDVNMELKELIQENIIEKFEKTK